MRLRLVSILIVLSTSPAATACIAPASSAHSAASIMRHFDEQEQEAHPGLIGIRASGWFLSPTTMVTVGHVALAMKLSDRDWKHVEIGTGERSHSIPTRIRRFAGPHPMSVAVLELQSAHPDAQGLQLRMDPLVPEEPVVSIAYPGGHQRVVSGRFVQYGDDGKLAGMALLEMYEGTDRLVLDHGSSGAPVLDCAGRVVAVVNNLLTTTIPFISGAVRVSTSWGNPNVVSVPVPVLKELARVD